MRALSSLMLLLTTSLILLSCMQETEELDLPDYEPQRLTELLPMKPGKTITYRLDSIIPVQQGRALAIHRYQVRDVWDTLVTDIMGRPAWRVFRYLNDSLASGSWKEAGTYTITQYTDRIEFNEDNLRTVRLQLPLRLQASWKGNKYLPDAPYGAYNINNFAAVNDWQYTYTRKAPEKVGTRLFQNVWTVTHLDEITDTLSLSNPQQQLYGIGFSEDKYAAGVGLVARQMLLLENNPNQLNATTFDPYKIGFGYRMWLIGYK